MDRGLMDLSVGLETPFETEKSYREVRSRGSVP